MGYLIFLLILFSPGIAQADPVSVVVAAAVAGAQGVAAGLALTAIATNMAISAALSIVGQLLTGKPDTPSNSFATIRSRGATQQFRQPVTERKMVYGEVRTSGATVYAGVTENNKYLHLMIEIATHEIEEIGEILINDLSIGSDDLDGNGVVQSGRYADLIRIKKNLGTTDQLADSDAVDDIPEWTVDHRLRGIAYVYVRMQWDRDVFTSGIPNISMWVKGKKCVDPRDDVEKWTPNIAIQANDYLTNTYFGLSAANVDDAELIGSCNTCDEFVTTTAKDFSINDVDTSLNLLGMVEDRLNLQTGDRVELIAGTVGGLTTSTDYYVIVHQRKENPRIALASSLENAWAGTAISLTSGTTATIRKNAEPRYHGGGILKMSAARGENLKDIISGMAGIVVYAGGKWRILAGEYQTPTVSFDEGDLVGPIKIQTKVSERERFNRAQGIYVSPINDGNPSDYPLVKNDTYTAEDGKALKRDIDCPFTPRAHTAQRLAKLQMERMRQEIVFTAKYKLTGFKVQVGDNFYQTFEQFGWSSKVFEVISWALSTDKGSPVIEITARENASSVYDWNNGEETAVDPAPNSSLPSPFIVSVVGGFSLDSILVDTQSGDKIFKVEASWELNTDVYVNSGGRYEIEFKKSTEADTEYRSAAKVDGSISRQEITGLLPDIEYDIRIYAFNYIGVRSSQATLIENFVVGSTVTTNTEDWENEILSRDSDDWENDTLSSEDWES